MPNGQGANVGADHPNFQGREALCNPTAELRRDVADDAPRPVLSTSTVSGGHTPDLTIFGGPAPDLTVSGGPTPDLTQYTGEGMFSPTGKRAAANLAEMADADQSDTVTQPGVGDASTDELGSDEEEEEEESAGLGDHDDDFDSDSDATEPGSPHDSDETEEGGDSPQGDMPSFPEENDIARPVPGYIAAPNGRAGAACPPELVTTIIGPGRSGFGLGQIMVLSRQHPYHVTNDASPVVKNCICTHVNPDGQTCNRLFKLAVRTAGYSTSHAIAHGRNTHGKDWTMLSRPPQRESIIGRTTRVCASVGGATTGRGGKRAMVQSRMPPAFHGLSVKEKRLWSQMRELVYSANTNFSASLFEDPFRQEMYMDAMNGDGDESHMMSRRMLESWVDGEFNIFKQFVLFMVDKQWAFCRGNPILQVFHDDGTLDNGHKYTASGINFLDCDAEWTNLNITVGFDRASTKMCEMVHGIRGEIFAADTDTDDDSEPEDLIDGADETFMATTHDQTVLVDVVYTRASARPWLGIAALTTSVKADCAGTITSRYGVKEVRLALLLLEKAGRLHRETRVRWRKIGDRRLRYLCRTKGLTVEDAEALVVQMETDCATPWPELSDPQFVKNFCARVGMETPSKIAAELLRMSVSDVLQLDKVGLKSFSPKFKDLVMSSCQVPIRLVTHTAFSVYRLLRSCTDLIRVSGRTLPPAASPRRWGFLPRTAGCTKPTRPYPGAWAR
jgi:hypothetical protein